MTSEPTSGVSDRSGGGGCLRCGGVLESTGVEEFRIGGTGGGWKLLFGEFAELGEGKIPLELLACRRCRHVELRLPAGG
jgi:hypothetical protein